MRDKAVAANLNEQMASAVYLQVSTISQALIFVTRSRSWSFVERPGFLLVIAFLIAQLVREILLFYLIPLITNTFFFYSKSKPFR